MATFTKSITAQFEQVGRRQKLVGQLGEIRDETGILIHSQLYNTPFEAEIKLDALTRELLTDYAERGLVDALPEVTGTTCITCGDDGDCDCPDRSGPGGTDLYAAAFEEDDDPNLLNTTSGSGVSCACGAEAVLWVHGKNIHDDVCQDCFTRFYENNHEDSRSWEVDPIVPAPVHIDPVTAHTAQMLANRLQTPAYVVKQHGHFLIQDDADLACYGGRADVVATYQPLAQTRQSQAIEARLTVCGYCAGIHHVQACPILRNAVRAETWKGADLGRGLCQLLWRNHAGFVELFQNATPTRLVEYAESYLMFLASRSSTNLTTREVLATWAREMGGDRGPAAPAMSVAA